MERAPELDSALDELPIARRFGKSRDQLGALRLCHSSSIAPGNRGPRRGNALDLNAREVTKLLEHLRSRGILHGIATSGRRPEIDLSLDALGVGDDMVVIDRGGVARAKPEPDLFLACQAALGVEPEDCYVVGDAVWDLLAARRAGMLSVGLRSGGYGSDELLDAGAFRVYDDPAELHESLDELGFDA